MFRAVAIAALITAFGQITFGGIVRVTESGLGCPDWPLCHGRLIPPFEFETLIEYTHRLFGSLVGILVIATAATAWYQYRSVRWIYVSAVLSLVLVILAGALGGVTVLTELEWWWRLIHLSVAEGLVACLVVVVIAGWRPNFSADGTPPLTQDNPRLGRMVMTSATGIFLLILSGSYMVGEGAGSSCATWPLCRGDVFPSGEPYMIHMTHRFIAALVGLHAVATAYAIWKRRSWRPAMGWWAAALGVAFGAQVIVGAATVWSGFDDGWKAMHLSLATMSWISVVFIAALIYTPRRLALPLAHTLRGKVSNLESMVS